MTKYVLDSSALIALLNEEEGADKVFAHLAEAIMSTVNVAEVVTILCREGMAKENITSILRNLIYNIVPFDESQSYQTGFLYNKTKTKGLSLGDRACIALAAHLNLPVLTADKLWTQIDCGVKIILIR